MKSCLMTLLPVSALAMHGAPSSGTTLSTWTRTSSFPSSDKDLTRDLRSVLPMGRRDFWAEWVQGSTPHSLVKTVPAAIKRRRATATTLQPKVQQVVSTKTKEITKQVVSKLPHLAPPKDDTGFFYGFTIKLMDASTTDRPPPIKKPSMKESVALTLDEIRTMRAEMEALRKELQMLKQELAPASPVASGEMESQLPPLLTKKEAETIYNRIGRDLERWATQMMNEGVEDGWVEIKCNKAMRKSFNPDGKATTFLKWMKDSRPVSSPDDTREYPCLKCTGVIDAPLEVVCLYLSQERNMNEYNDLVETYRDLQEITPSSKVCLGQTPQILFIKPRSLITYCQHRWLGDGSQMLLSQACRHPKKLTKENAGRFLKEDDFDDQKRPMAFALRGANYIGRDPEDPQHKTRITILAHGNPGKDVPSWAMKTAVGALANIEPFKLFYKINEGIKKKLPELQEELEQAQLVSKRPDGRTSRPAGIAQLGYACFWPNGGGLVDKPSVSNSAMPSENSTLGDTDKPAETPGSTENLGTPVPVDAS